MRSMFKSCASAVRLLQCRITRCNLPIYLSIHPHAHCLSRCGYTQLFYPFYCVRFRPSFIGLLTSTVLPSRFHFAFLTFSKILRHGFAFGFLSTDTLELRYEYIFICRCVFVRMPCIPQNQNRTRFASENLILPQQSLSNPHSSTLLSHRWPCD